MPSATQLASLQNVATSRSVLVLDDDRELVEALTDVLEAEGFAVEAFTSPAEALQRLSRPPALDVLFVDYRMPEMDGAQFVRALASARIDVPVVLMTGVGEAPSIGRRLQVALVLAKPVRLEALLEGLALVLAQSGEWRPADTGTRMIPVPR
jgi:CheY-like chemotaxis protein